MKQYLRSFSLLASAVFLTGCSTTASVGISHAGFGNAVRQNIVAQAVNPEAPENDDPIEANGARAARAQARYLADQVEEPADISSSQGLAGGDGGGGGGGNAGGN